MDRSVHADGEAVELLQGFETPEAGESVPTCSNRFQEVLLVILVCDFLFRVHAMPDVSWPRAALPKGSSGWGVPPSVISAHGIHVPWLEIGFGSQNALRNVMLGS